MKKVIFKLITILLCIFISSTFVPQKAVASSTLAAPTGLAATASSSDQINLSWNVVSDATQYYVYRANSLTGTYTYIGTVTTPSYNSTGLAAATPYYYKVQAINSTGASDFSTGAWATTLANSSSSVGTSSPITSDRYAGNDRYETSAKIAQSGWKTSYYAILASGENFPDALCAAPLASKYNAPILLTSTDQLNDVTQNELLNLNVKNVIIIGGEGVVTLKVEQALKDLGITVSRIAGMDRYETSLNVAKMLGDFNEAVVATGDEFPDVLSISPIAAQKGMPILLTPQNNITNSLKDFIKGKAQKTYVLGDSGVISDNVISQLPSPQRLSGSNRYQANVQIINTFINDLNLSTCYLATGEVFPDALSGSTLAALSKSPVILVKDPLDQATASFIQSNSSSIKKVIALGGTGAVSDSLLTSIAPVSDTGPGSDANDLPVPINVVASSVSSSQIYISWNSVSSATSYNVYRATSNSGQYTKIASVNTPYYSDSYLPSGITYYYKVQTANPMGTSSYSSIVYTSTQSSDGILSAPANVAAKVLSSSQIELTWDSVSNATSYNVYRTTADSAIYSMIGSVSTNDFTDSSVSSGVTYYYKIQTVYANNTGPYSDVVTAIAMLNNGVLANPTNVITMPLNSNEIYMSWNSVANATYYNVYRSTSYNGTYTNVATVIYPYFKDTGLTGGMVYYYKVQAANSAGSSNFSDIVYILAGK